jgi:hypothetical protein
MREDYAFYDAQIDSEPVGISLESIRFGARVEKHRVASFAAVRSE